MPKKRVLRSGKPKVSKDFQTELAKTEKQVEQWKSIAAAYKNSLRNELAKRTKDRQFLKVPIWKSWWEQVVSKLKFGQKV